MSKQQNIVASTVASIVLTAAVTISAPPAHSGDAGWFIGGVAAARIGANMRRRTQAEEVQAYNSSRAAQPVQQAAPVPTQQTPQQRIQQLDKLAAGGYITPEEYKAKKKAILDAM